MTCCEDFPAHGSRQWPITILLANLSVANCVRHRLPDLQIQLFKFSAASQFSFTVDGVPVTQTVTGIVDPEFASGIYAKSDKTDC